MQEMNRENSIVISGIGPLCPTIPDWHNREKREEQLNHQDDTRNNPGWFDPALYLGKRGYKYLTTANRYLLAAVRIALDDAEYKEDSFPAESQGIIIGSNFATASVLKELYKTVWTQGDTALNPVQTTDFCINVPTGYVSMKHGFKGCNLTLVNPLVAGLESVVFARQALQQEKVEFCMAGAMEDVCPQEISADWGLETSCGGACVLSLESGASALERGHSAYAVIGECALHFFSPNRLNEPEALRAIRKSLEASLLRMLPGKPSQIHVGLLECLHPVNIKINSLLIQILAESGFSVDTPRLTGADGRYGTVSPVLMLSHIAFQYGEGLIAAVSPAGQIVLVNLIKI